MSILIMGMEMPTGCYNCPLLAYGEFITGGFSYCKILQEEIKNVHVRMVNCPLVEIPTSHGRLVDGDALADMCDDPRWCVWLSDINDAPTIVEAEGEQHGK